MASQGEIYLQNIHLTEENEELKQRVDRAKGNKEVDLVEDHTVKNRSCYRRFGIFLLIVVLVLMLLSALGYLMATNFILSRSSRSRPAEPMMSVFSRQTQSLSRSESGLLQKVFLNLGLRSDSGLQECQGPFMKKSFPDIDYAFRGYNVLKGYPQAIGHDPGLTHPIFFADYSQQRQTSDCRYSLPAGVFAVPDVSCITSFKSEEITTSYQYSRSLSAQAKVEGGGWGVSFSASAGYKEASSEMSTGQTVYVLSSANCNYYSTSLDLTAPPPFERGFLQWSQKLVNASDEEVIEFVDYYGTHYLQEVTFGAKYIYQHKMSSDTYRTLSSSEFSVSVQASYSGLFSVGGGFGLDSSQSQAASRFSKSVETSTITVGAPPPSNGDAMTWASTVKDTPVPVYYSMATIEELFTARFMAHVSFDYAAVRKRLEGIRESGKYCKALRNKGMVDSCKNFGAGYELEGTCLRNPYQGRDAGEATCIEDCLKDKRCVGVTVEERRSETKCYFYSGVWVGIEEKSLGKKCKSIIFQHKIQSAGIKLSLHTAHVPRGERGTSGDAHNATECEQSCFADPQCDAFEFCNRQGHKGCRTKRSNLNSFREFIVFCTGENTEAWCAQTTNNCHLFSVSDIKSIERASFSRLTFIIRPSL